MFENTQVIEDSIRRINAGDTGAQEQLIGIAAERLQNMTRQMLRGFPNVSRWEQTDDVYQNANVRLLEALNAVELSSSLHFFRLAALQIRRELIDLSRRNTGPLGIGANHNTVRPQVDEQTQAVGHDPAELTMDPSKIASWCEFHQAVESLPEEERQVVDLLWYHELSQTEAAELLQVSTRTVKRRWRAVRMQLHDLMAGIVEGVDEPVE